VELKNGISTRYHLVNPVKTLQPIARSNVGQAFLPAAAFPGGWTRWKAGPQAE
jgi:hypothetical protein